MISRAELTHWRATAPWSDDVLVEQDLVQREAAPIGPVMDSVRKTLGPWLGEAKTEQNQGPAMILFRYETKLAPGAPINNRVPTESVTDLEEWAWLPIKLLLDELNFSKGREK